MLVPLPLFLARAKRARRPVFGVPITTPEILQAATEAADRADGHFFFVVDSTRRHTLPFSTLYYLSLLQAEQTRNEVSLLVYTAPREKEAGHLLDMEVPALAVRWSGEARNSVVPFTAWLAQQAHRRKTALIGSLPHFMPAAKIGSFVEQSGVQGLILPIAIREEGRLSVSYPHVRDVHKVARVPLLSEDSDLSSEDRRQCRKEGVIGFIGGTQLEEAYAAGLRSGLRDRYSTDPTVYQKMAMEGLKSTLESYL